MRMKLPNGMTVNHMNHAETAMLYRDIFADRCYVQHGIRIPANGTVLDVGANIGLSTLFFHTENPRLTFHAFEPAPQTFVALEENMKLHSIAGTATRCAISDYSGTTQMTFYPNCTVMSGLHADSATEAALSRSFLLASGFTEKDADALLASKYRAVQVECPVRSLTDIIAERHITSIDLLKIDAEKSELQVLRGLSEDGWTMVRQIVAEVQDVNGSMAAFVELLTAHGFSVESEQDPLLSGTNVYEVFAVPNAN